jgi:AraC-like DNA-binding protein
LQRGFAPINATPSRYFLTKRLEQFRRGDLISIITYEAGSSDLSYFRRCFRKAFGTCPRAALTSRIGLQGDTLETIEVRAENPA